MYFAYLTGYDGEEIEFIQELTDRWKNEKLAELFYLAARRPAGGSSGPAIRILLVQGALASVLFAP